ncbi:cytochrome b [Sphingomonas montanisoli]|uniref:Cytochrome b n=1 Tax=Sphingomonas montanisoli TaxID=2606412 RepID=A0A5D9C0D8_9SPHN|nr:cytochrome b [Sphingomonas montanisoli]TZG24732.1 cytochrome b [Sphingomonas montanisoli]
MPTNDMNLPRYTKPAIILHWVIAVLMIGNLLVGLFFTKLPDDWIRPVLDAHKSTGITVLGLVLLRVLWRIGHKPPPFSHGMAAWERVAAHVAHFGLYVFMLLMPLTGWFMDSAWKDADSHPMFFFGTFEWPRIGHFLNMPLEQKNYWHDLFGAIHQYAGYALFWLIILHVAGALKHQFIDREPEFQRMWPR